MTYQFLFAWKHFVFQYVFMKYRLLVWQLYNTWRQFLKVSFILKWRHISYNSDFCSPILNVFSTFGRSKKISSLLFFSNLIMIWKSVVFFIFILLVFHWAYLLCKFILLNKFGNVLVIISSNSSVVQLPFLLGIPNLYVHKIIWYFPQITDILFIYFFLLCLILDRF